MANRKIMLLQDNNILEFLKILNGANMESKANEYADFFNSFDAMQNQLTEALAEIKNVRKQLDDIQNKKNPIKTAFSAIVDNMKKELQAIQEQLNKLKETLILKTKEAIRFFKEKGISALNGIFKVFHIKQGFQNLIKSSAETIESCNKSIAKIESISNEYHAVGLHTRNLGRAMVGKETAVDPKQKGKLAKALQSFVKFRKSMSAGFKRKCESALLKLDNLEKTVWVNREISAKRKTDRKPSLFKRLKEKDKIADNERKTSDKAKNREAEI